MGNRRLVEGLGFSRLEFDSIQEYGSTENIVRTYGFIFGRNAIDYLKRAKKTSIRWTFYLHYRYKDHSCRCSCDPTGSVPR